MLPIVKRRQGCQQYPEQNKDEQALSESSLNKLVGAADVYNLEVASYEILSLPFQIQEYNCFGEVCLFHSYHTLRVLNMYRKWSLLRLLCVT